MNVARYGPFAAIVCIFSAVLIGGTVELKRAPHQIDINIDGKPFTTYYFDPEVAKPYLMPLRTASGDIVTRGFPIRNDVSAGNPKAGSFEPHQRPLYFGHGDIDGLDFWEEPVFDKYYSDHGHQAYGHMVLKSIEESREEQETAMIRARFTLDDPSNRVIGEETQSFSFHGDGQTRVDRLRIRPLCDCRSARYGRHQGGHFRYPVGSRTERTARPHGQLKRRGRGTGDLGQARRLGRLLRNHLGKAGRCGRTRSPEKLSPPDHVARARVRFIRRQSVRPTRVHARPKQGRRLDDSGRKVTYVSLSRFDP